MPVYEITLDDDRVFEVETDQPVADDRELQSLIDDMLTSQPASPATPEATPPVPQAFPESASIPQERGMLDRFTELFTGPKPPAETSLSRPVSPGPLPDVEPPARERAPLPVPDAGVELPTVAREPQPAHLRPRIDLGGGRYATERTITVTHPGINQGQPTLIPTIFGGRILGDPDDFDMRNPENFRRVEQEAVQRIINAGGIDPDTGAQLPSFETVEEADAFAKERSAKGGARPDLLTPEQADDLAYEQRRQARQQRRVEQRQQQQAIFPRTEIRFPGDTAPELPPSKVEQPKPAEPSPELTPEQRLQEPLATKAAKSFAAGVGNLESTTGTILKYLGAEETGQRLKEAGEETVARYQVPRTKEFSWRSLLDPEFYAVNMTETLPLSLSLLPVAIAGAYLGSATATAAGLGAFGRLVLGSLMGAAASRPIESAFEAAQQYDAALLQGATEEEATQQAEQVFKDNLALAGTDVAQIGLAMSPLRGTGVMRRAISAAGKVVGEPVIEAVEEGVQDIIQRRASGEPIRFDPQMQESIASGFLLGAGMGTGAALYHQVIDRVNTEMSPEQRMALEARIQERVNAGTAESEAVQESLDEFASTEQGQAVVRRTMQDLKAEAQQVETEEAPAETQQRFEDTPTIGIEARERPQLPVAEPPTPELPAAPERAERPELAVGEPQEAEPERPEVVALPTAPEREAIRDQVEPEPTPAQAEAGNYSKGHLAWQGLDISIETPKGGVRRAADRSWEVPDFPADYGYIKRSEGADGEQVDVYVGDNLESDRVWVVDQVDADSGEFDEHKAMLGFGSQEEAVETYRRGFSDGRADERMGNVTEMTVDEFKTWLKEGETTKPVAGQAEEPPTDPVDRLLQHPDIEDVFSGRTKYSKPAALAQLRTRIRKILRQERGAAPSGREAQQLAEQVLDRQTAEGVEVPQPEPEPGTQPEPSAGSQVGKEVRRIERAPYNFVLYDDGEIRISSGGRFIQRPSEKLMTEAREALEAEPGSRPATTPPEQQPGSAATRPTTLEGLASQIEEQGARTQGRIERERVEAETGTRLRPTAPQEAPGGIFEPQQELGIRQPPKATPKTPDNELELQQFIRRHKGIRLIGEELRGELEALGSPKETGTTGIINSRSGVTLQRMAEMAQEAGFIAGDDKTELLEALERSIGGQPVYSIANPAIFDELANFFGDEVMRDLAPRSSRRRTGARVGEERAALRRGRIPGVAELETYASRGTQAPEVKALFRRAARLMHPDLGNQNDPADVRRREEFMKALISAFEGSDTQRLEQLIDRFEQGWVAPEQEQEIVTEPPPEPADAPTEPPEPPPPPPYSSAAPPKSPMEMPEIVELGKALFEGEPLSIGIQKVLRRDAGVRGYFSPKTGIRLRADIFADPEAAAQTLAHEIGHAVDWIEGEPSKTLKRGNILGSIASLHRFMRREFGGINNKDIRDELIKFTAAWKPFDPAADPAYTKYRHNARELYADFISGLLNAPAWTQQVAPRTFDAFFKFLDKKPRAKALYDGIQRRIETGGISQRRRERVQAMFARGEQARRERAEARAERSRWQGFSDFIMKTFVDADHPILQKVRQAERTGNLNPDDNPRYWMERLRYGKSEERAWLSGIERVHTSLEQAGISPDDFGAILFHERVINERGEYANPEGFTPRSSRQQLTHITHDLGIEKFQQAQAIAGQFREAWRGIRARMREAEILAPETLDKLDANDFYATFNVLHHFEAQEGAQGEFGMSSGVFSQIGTLNEVENPYVATVMKGVSTLRMIQRKEAAHALAEFLQANVPDSIEPAKRGAKGRLLPSRNREKGLLAYPHEGKLQGFYIPKEMADRFNSEPTVYQMAGRYLSALANPFRSLFVKYNPGFMVFNAIRDPISTAINLPVKPVQPPFGGPIGRGIARAGTLAKGAAMPVLMTRHFLAAVPPSLRRGFRKPDRIIEEMERGKMLVSIMDEATLNEDDASVERLLKSYSLRPAVWESKVAKPFTKILNFVEGITTASEMMSKVAAYQYLRNIPGFTQAEKEHMVRVLAGTPPIMRRGEAAPIYNNILLFSNVAKEGYRRDFEALKRDPADYAIRRVVWSIAPKLIMAAIAAGLLGDDNKAILDAASEYDKTNYSVIPLALRPDGKAIYLRIPNDELGRAMGGVVWKSRNAITDTPGGSITALFDYMAGQAPTLNPLYEGMIDTVRIALGRNPMDWFRGRPIVPEQEFEAGGWRRWASYLRHVWNNMGGTVFFRDLPRYVLPEPLSAKKAKLREAERDEARTWLEKTLNTPVGLLAPVQRFLKITDQGHSDRLRAIAQEVRQEKAQGGQEINERIVDFIHNNREALPYAIPDTVLRGLYTSLGTEGLPVGEFSDFKRRAKQLSFIRVDSPHFQAYIHAESKAERLKIMEDYQSLEK